MRERRQIGGVGAPHCPEIGRVAVVEEPIALVPTRFQAENAQVELEVRVDFHGL